MLDDSNSSQKHARRYGLDCIRFILYEKKNDEKFSALDDNNDSAMYHNYQSTR